MNVKLPSKREIKKAALILKSGGVIVYPTDTVVGIGCLWNNQEGIRRIYQIKKRPNIPMPVLVCSLEQLNELRCKITPQAKKLINLYWPGGLTLILPQENTGTLGVRMPAYKPLLELINLVGPIIGTSANLHQKPPVGRTSDLPVEFVKLVDFVLEGECILKKESTVVDCSGEYLKVLRIGAIDLDLNREMILSIDTSDSKKIVLQLKSYNQVKMIEMENKKGSEVLLAGIVKLLDSHKIDFSDITEIEVNEGPGSFTGLRVGIAVANALAYILKLPINGRPVGKLSEPKYT